MTTFKLYLDKRGLKKNDVAPLKISINKKGLSAFISLGVKVLPSQWDSKSEKVFDHPMKSQINLYLEHRKTQLMSAYMELQPKGKLVGLTPIQIKKVLLSYIDPEAKQRNLFVARFRHYAEKQKNENTRGKYLNTLNRITEFDKSASTLTFEDISKDWLTDFGLFLENKGNSINTRGIHFRNIRTVVNDAIDNGITKAYPFRKFHIKTEQTEKRSLTLEQLRALFNYNAEFWQFRYIDVFKLTFFLIGINPIDLYNLTDITADGRIIYNRAKTHRLYDIKVEPEAMEIIKRYKGKKHLLCFAEQYKRSHNFISMIDRGLKSIGPAARIDNPKYFYKSRKYKFVTKRIPAFPDLSLYWARHTWATIAAELDIPKETIAKALGHGGSTVTDIYINFDNKKIDEANRKVIDWVLYGEK
nr:site-specific integrase [uncultured Prevotella sp.]